MANVLRKQVAREEIERVAAVIAPEHLNPKEVFYWRVRPAIDHAACAIQMANFLLQRRAQIGGGPPVRHQIEMFDLLAHDPPRHRVNVEADGCASGSVGLYERRSSSHEWISDTLTGEVLRAIEFLTDWP